MALANGDVQTLAPEQPQLPATHKSRPGSVHSPLLPQSQWWVTELQIEVEHSETSAALALARLRIALVTVVFALAGRIPRAADEAAVAPGAAPVGARADLDGTRFAEARAHHRIAHRADERRSLGQRRAAAVAPASTHTRVPQSESEVQAMVQWLARAMQSSAVWQTSSGLSQRLRTGWQRKPALVSLTRQSFVGVALKAARLKLLGGGSVQVRVSACGVRLVVGRCVTRTRSVDGAVRSGIGIRDVAHACVDAGFLAPATAARISTTVRDCRIDTVTVANIDAGVGHSPLPACTARARGAAGAGPACGPRKASAASIAGTAAGTGPFVIASATAERDRAAYDRDEPRERRRLTPLTLRRTYRSRTTAPS